MPTRDPTATKERLLAAALHEFSAKGIAGARVDAIAARAGVNKRMLYYYFGSKDELFRAILRQRLAEYTVTSEATGPGLLPRLDPLDVRQERAIRHAEYVRLLMWEALQAPSDTPANEAVRRDFYRAWVETVEAEQAAGKLPADLDAAQLVLSEILLTIGPVAFPQLCRLITGRTVDDPEFIARRVEFLDRWERRMSSAATARH